jgi:hypothetical protein
MVRAISQVTAWFLLLFALGITTATAADNTPLALYESGDYAAAADAASKQGSAAGYALAARAVVAEASLRDAPCMECFKRAEALARQAIAADANYLEGQLQLVVALGYQARLMGPLRARFQRLPEQAQNAIETALHLAPDDQWALSAAGGFNIEVVRMGGRLFGNLFYGASFDDGVAYFKRAIGKDPNNPVIKLQYALSLTSYAFDARRSEITAVLESAAHGPAADAYGKANRERAAGMLDLLQENKTEEYLLLAHRYLGFPP